ncbi:hypothetical protein Drose_18350 [Dactylosporangium roseum]|uniref:Secreted protein n=1 Tax=Dactylosporangium roseum TaxID=47989 RepID=A0ABY5ZEI5_9ACTN|nr:hypothetical protein [Dactylosporangium roseum]UWZ39991.1 hypothetical protein Drose_18350 [Dactylosporangium roseum]
MTLKKTLMYAAGVFIVYFVAFRPDSAARVVRGLLGGIARIGTGFGDFFSRLVG